jgi:GntR family transcriptional repressor for pyruvate dehydrogenase complex
MLKDRPAKPPVVLPRMHRSLAHSVVEMLSDLIHSGALKPGDKLPTESEVMLLQGVSRAVVREALTRMQASGLVVTRRGIGTFVLEPPEVSNIGIDFDTVITLRDVLAILELRISLETEVAYLAARRRTDEQLLELRQALDELHRCRMENLDTAAADVEFHLVIAQSAGNRYFHEILHHLGSKIIPRTRISLGKLTPTDLARVNQEHEDIYTAIRRQDPEMARATMRSHLSNSRERLLLAQESDRAPAAS